jgi:hypothetical protein
MTRQLLFWIRDRFCPICPGSGYAVSSLFFVSLSILKYILGYVLLAIVGAVAVGGEITP